MGGGPEKNQVIDPKYFESINSIKNIDGLINNVGIAGPTKYLDKITNTEWENTISTNLNSHFYFFVID